MLLKLGDHSYFNSTACAVYAAHGDPYHPAHRAVVALGLLHAAVQGLETVVVWLSIDWQPAALHTSLPDADDTWQAHLLSKPQSRHSQTHLQHHPAQHRVST